MTRSLALRFLGSLVLLSLAACSTPIPQAVAPADFQIKADQSEDYPGARGFHITKHDDDDEPKFEAGH
ncbi:MAG: hypothetical protein ACAI44_18010 [Candidatus Sericytochromatia bacterium]